MDRIKNIEAKDRICFQCNFHEVEDEVHFLVECPKYNDIRSQLFKSIFDISHGKWNLSVQIKHDCFILLINGTLDDYQNKIFVSLHNYLVQAFKLRVDNI